MVVPRVWRVSGSPPRLCPGGNGTRYSEQEERQFTKCGGGKTGRRAGHQGREGPACCVGCALQTRPCQALQAGSREDLCGEPGAAPQPHGAALVLRARAVEREILWPPILSHLVISYDVSHVGFDHTLSWRKMQGK